MRASTNIHVDKTTHVVAEEYEETRWLMVGDPTTEDVTVAVHFAEPEDVESMIDELIVLSRRMSDQRRGGVQDEG